MRHELGTFIAAAAAAVVVTGPWYTSSSLSFFLSLFISVIHSLLICHHNISHTIRNEIPIHGWVQVSVRN